LKIALQVADALVVAHANGVLHRDLKPDNIFLSQLPGESDHATVLDFGMSRFRSEASKLRTRVGAIMGTPAYMAPEQLIDTSSVDARADIYGLGVTLYEVLTGKVPFEARSLMALTTRVAREPPPPLEELRPGLPPALCKAVVRALAKSPDDRFPDMAAFRQALQACAGMAEVDLDATFVHDGPPPERTMIVAPDQDQAKTGLLVVEDLLRSGKGAFDGEIPALERTRLVTEPAVERPRARAFEEMLARDEPIGLERTRIATEPAAPRPDPKILEASRRGQPPPSALAKRSARVQTRMIVGVVLGAGAVLLALIGLDILGKRLTRGSASPPVDPPPSSAGR